MTYHRGTLTDFQEWHERAKQSEHIPAEGKIGEVLGHPAPDAQRTYAYVTPIQNPDGSDDYVWLYLAYPNGLPDLTQEEVNELGWGNG